MANNDKESKNEIEDYRDCITFKNKAMRRGKPHQQIYRPGSGPLRKSVNEMEENDVNVKHSRHMNETSYDFKSNRKKDEERNHDSENLNNSGGYMDPRSRRHKKPEQPIYVPKPIAEREVHHMMSANDKASSISMTNLNKSYNYESDHHRGGGGGGGGGGHRKTDQRNGNMSHYNNGTSDRSNSYSKSKRFSANRRLGLEHVEQHGGAGNDLESRGDRRHGGGGGNRHSRQASEPRVLGPQSHNMNNRVRDTRSVEPAGNSVVMHNYEGNKIQAKPPSGRRHSTICLETGKPHKPMPNLDSLPPRFRRKYLQENNIDPSTYPGVLDDTWDGSSVTFQGSERPPPHAYSQQNLSYQPMETRSQGPVPSYVNNAFMQHHEPPAQAPAGPPPPVWSYTIPDTRIRGRGRFRPDTPEQFANPIMRSLTPDRAIILSPSNSRPCTPPPFAHRNKSVDNINTLDNHRCRTPVQDNKVNLNIVGRVTTTTTTTTSTSTTELPPEKNSDMIQKQVVASPPPPPISPSIKTANQNTVQEEEPNEILDWSEEVELNERLEAEALSDSMTRCSSVASLVENTSHPHHQHQQQQHQHQQQQQHKPRKNRRNRGSRNRSSSRNSKRDRSTDNQNRSNVNNEIDSNHNKHQNRKNNSKHSSNNDLSHGSSRENVDKDGFRVPPPDSSSRNNRRRKNSFRDKSNERSRRGGDRRENTDCSRNSSADRSRRNSYNEVENWREEIRLRCTTSENKQVKHQTETISPDNIVADLKEQCDKPKPGIIILPQQPVDRFKPPVLNLPESMSRNRPMQQQHQQQQQHLQQQQAGRNSQQRTLYDPNNPNKPIIVTTSNSRIPNIETASQSDNAADVSNAAAAPAQAQYTTDQYGNVGPSWYDPYSENFRVCRKQNHLLLLDIKKADFELQYIIKSGLLMQCWNNEVALLRKFFRDSLEFLLIRDIKFCSIENVENHFWKILYYNVIELMRKSIVNDAENKAQYKGIILSLIDEGTKYFEKLLEALEEGYGFKLDNYVGINSLPETKGLGFIGLALVSAQKIFLFLGDLARYKENVNETTNYGKCRQWYIKAQEINPKNGRPYNQLALLAVYARRKLDAVYYYMRSLMSSNPVQSAKESLLSLFDENRKKYEQSERKRREEKAKLQMKEKELTQTTPGSLRREIWINPDGGRRLHRTTSAAQETTLDSEEEDLQSLPSIEVNKRFITSYLHVHGKLITKIGMETFQHAALQMLREFRVLLQQTPVHLSCTRFLHLLALNMFAIDSTQLKGPELEPGCRSEVQERALIVSLQMFNIILERCVDLLQIHLRQQERAEAVAAAATVLQTQTQTDTTTSTTTTEETGNHNVSQQHQPIPLSQDLQVLLPAVKVWCDWMLCHSSVWNPPPSCVDYQIGPSSDAWGRLAILMNQLEKLDYSKPHLEDAPYTDNNVNVVRLPEDIIMCGFTPLMCHFQPTVHVRKQVDMESAQMSFRINQLLFFGTEFLCGLEPPVLKLQRYDTFSEYEYVSVVRTSSRDSPTSTPVLCNEDLLVESFSEDEDENKEKCSETPGGVEAVAMAMATPGEIRSLLDRKVELERRQRTQELHRQRVQAILQQSVVSVEIEIRPRYLVPDTNCFIDYLDKLQALAKLHGPHTYTLMVPLVVLGELEGLTRGGKSPAPTPRMSLDPEHMMRVAESARRALDFLHCRNPAVKCLTTRGTVLTSSTFTSEDEDRSQDVGPRNDDRILATCISLCRSNQHQQQQQDENGAPRKIYREVVLLTDDRNLRVKALARDVPVRELPDFLQWAGLG